MDKLLLELELRILNLYKSIMIINQLVQYNKYNMKRKGFMIKTNSFAVDSSFNRRP